LNLHDGWVPTFTFRSLHSSK